jgi:3,4-dihydroxy 2-butanone 4-phosphate synthase/GTP cyclohydrolase II
MTLPTVSKPRHDPVTAISPIADIIADARNGKPFILVDADDRENEGDIIIPRSSQRPTASIRWRPTLAV